MQRYEVTTIYHIDGINREEVDNLVDSIETSIDFDPEDTQLNEYARVVQGSARSDVKSFPRRGGGSVGKSMRPESLNVDAEDRSIQARTVHVFPQDHPFRAAEDAIRDGDAGEEQVLALKELLP